MVVSLLLCDGLVLPYSIDIYDKDYIIKIELTQKINYNTSQNLKIKPIY